MEKEKECQEEASSSSSSSSFSYVTHWSNLLDVSAPFETLFQGIVKLNIEGVTYVTTGSTLTRNGPNFFTALLSWRELKLQSHQNLLPRCIMPQPHNPAARKRSFFLTANGGLSYSGGKSSYFYAKPCAPLLGHSYTGSLGVQSVLIAGAYRTVSIRTIFFGYGYAFVLFYHDSISDSNFPANGFFQTENYTFLEGSKLQAIRFCIANPKSPSTPFVIEILPFGDLALVRCRQVPQAQFRPFRKERS